MKNQIQEFITDEDQWFTHGWRFENNEIRSFTVDRKEQNMQIGRTFSIEEFLTDDNVEIEAKRWLKDLLGDECDILIEEDIPY